MNMVSGWWKGLWERWLLYMRQLARYNRLRADYLKIAGMPPQVTGSWMDGEAALLMLNEKEVGIVGSEPFQRKLFD